MKQKAYKKKKQNQQIKLQGKKRKQDHQLSKEIIKEIKDRSDVYKFFNGTTVKGNYKIPKKTVNGRAEWVDENPATDPTATIPKLELIELG